MLHNFTFNSSSPNVSFLSQECQMVGRKINTEGRFPTDTGTDALSNFPQLRNMFSLKRFLGMVRSFREYMPNMASKTPHL